MKYQCICRSVITGDVPGSRQRLLNQYVYAGSRANHAPTKSPPPAQSPPPPYWQAKCPIPGRKPYLILAI